ncbi:MAG: hypothetical protein DHS20C11_25480 [Lysobacteraceae bacterium]|nr:MAG: hypothetical protein DHS20C11_25480 [Xanthomonadaceae bacterium]
MPSSIAGVDRINRCRGKQNISRKDAKRAKKKEKYAAVAGKKKSSREYPKGTRGAKDRCRERLKKWAQWEKEGDEAAGSAALEK